MTRHAWTAIVMVLVGALGLPAGAAAQGDVTATLSVLAAPVERVGAGVVGAEPGATGMNLAEGDRVRTGAGGLALITFLNGTTVTVLPGSEVTVKQASTGRGTGGLRILLHAGRVWARVVQVAGNRSNLAIESNEYTATAHDGLIGAEQGAEGFVCWTRRGDLLITNRSGQSEGVVAAGQRAWARFSLPMWTGAFVPSASVLEVTTSGPVVPLVRMSDGRGVAGFLAENEEVNQVFGSLTEARRGRRWLVEVPGGTEGAYTLVLTGIGTGPFTVNVSARYAGFTASRRQLTGEVGPGERLVSRITLGVKGPDPQTARVVEMRVDDPHVGDGAEPAALVSGGSPGLD
jgi:hypothetical protein